ncbi:non-ribosomal peptide synthetase [Actinocatenispora sera]|uniref:Carrier domain-containing protein n=1 Tax=Actinocatenispora sera TaxID=390989 RepID=A0A810KZ71_9ACTN|nr:non-ribosomal peptide synthetase [Actinocatenispora sera]BCJ28483.1 hypothetical protein Asera_25910 [Actinocatenispora sera]
MTTIGSRYPSAPPDALRRTATVDVDRVAARLPAWREAHPGWRIAWSEAHPGWPAGPGAKRLTVEVDAGFDHRLLAAAWADLLGRPHRPPIPTGPDPVAPAARPDWVPAELAPGRVVEARYGVDGWCAVPVDDPGSPRQVHSALRAVLTRYTGTVGFPIARAVAGAAGLRLVLTGAEDDEPAAEPTPVPDGMPYRQAPAAASIWLVAGDAVLPEFSDDVAELVLANGWYPCDLVVVVAGNRIWLGHDRQVVDDELAECLAADLAATLRTGGLPDRMTIECPQPPELGARHRPSTAWRPARRTGTVLGRFAELAATQPDRPAVLADDGSLSYAELAAAAGGVARAIGAESPAGGRVAVLLGHGTGVVAAILGTLAAGAAYVPADPSYPPARLAHLLRDSGVHTVLVDSRTRRLAAELGAPRVVDVSAVPAAPLPVPDTDLDAEAYVLYTSGSTGLPKGVVQSHRNVLFAAGNHIDNARIDPDDRVAVLSSFSFDMAITDLFSALLSGSAAVPVDIRTHGLLHLVEALRDRKVSIYHSTPTVYRHLVAALEGGRLPAIRVVLLGGEVVHAADAEAYWRHFAPDGVFVNGYGATEISFIAQDHLTAPPTGGVVPVGHPLPGIDVTLCTPEGAPAALVGEIVVHSRHLALGYVGRPFPAVGEARTYRTGDLARRLPDGRLVHLGRVDRQVKIRGYRVELGEIEAVLAGLPGVRQAVAVARDRTAAGALPPERELICYAAGATGLDAGGLLARLSERLPHYLVPRAVVVLDQLPTTPTGKVDVAALPAAPVVTATAALPDDPLVRAVAAAWCAELGVPSVRLDRNFFDLGGHSLALAGVQRRLERDLSVRLPLLDLFEYPTVTALAARIATARRDIAGASTVDETAAGADRSAVDPAAADRAAVDGSAAAAERSTVGGDPARRGGVATSVGGDRLAARMARRAARRSAR